MKLSTGLENFKGEVSDDLSFAAVEIDKNYWLALPQRRNLCHRLSCDQPQPGSFFQRPREAEKRDPGNEVAFAQRNCDVIQNGAEKMNARPAGRSNEKTRVSFRLRAQETYAITASPGD